eukprot:3098938-Pyramimonas_sp.AAC.1
MVHEVPRALEARSASMNAICVVPLGRPACAGKASVRHGRPEEETHSAAFRHERREGVQGGQFAHATGRHPVSPQRWQPRQRSADAEDTRGDLGGAPTTLRRRGRRRRART